MNSNGNSFSMALDVSTGICPASRRTVHHLRTCASRHQPGNVLDGMYDVKLVCGPLHRRYIADAVYPTLVSSCMPRSSRNTAGDRTAIACDAPLPRCRAHLAAAPHIGMVWNGETEGLTNGHQLLAMTHRKLGGPT